MTIVQRRVFYGVVGKGDELIDHLNEGVVMLRGVGMAIKPRILSDHSSGRTDRVVMELEAENVDELFVFEDEVLAYPEGAEQMQKWFSRLKELAYYAEVDHWTVHQ